MAFHTTRVTTQGVLVSLTILNMVVENVIRTWLVMTVEDQMLAHGVLGETIRRYPGVFYFNDDMMGSREPDWMQHLINVLLGFSLEVMALQTTSPSHIQ